MSHTAKPRREGIKEQQSGELGLGEKKGRKRHKTEEEEEEGRKDMDMWM